MIKFSRFTWVIIGMFALSLISVMLNIVLPVFTFIGLAALSAGFMLLAIKWHQLLKKKGKEQEIIKEELLMELSVTENGEEYVMQNNKNSKKIRRKLRREKFDKFMPVIGCAVVSIVFLFILIKMIFKF